MATIDVTQIAYTDPNITDTTPIRVNYISEPRINVQYALTALDKHQGAQGDTVHPIVTTDTHGFAPVSIIALLDSYDRQLAEIEELLKSDPYPEKCIVQWAGEKTAIPNGWAACDGTQGTPDMRYRYPVGVASTIRLGSTGGSSNVVVDIGKLLLTHRHKYSNMFTHMRSRGPFGLDTRFGTITFASKCSCIDTDNYPQYFKETSGYTGNGATSGTKSVNYMPAHNTKWYIMKLPVVKQPKTTYTVTITQPKNGVIKTNLASNTVATGTRIMVSVVPNDGYVVDEILVNSAPIANHAIFYITKNTTITASLVSSV